MEESTAQYLAALDAADRQESMGGSGSSNSGKLRDKLTRLKAQMQKLKALQAAIDASPDKQVSLTDPDTRLMVIGDRLTGTVGYNVQTVTDTEHHLILAHAVTDHVGDRGQPPKMAAKAKDVLGFAEIDVLADTGYFNSPDLLACHQIGVHALVPRPNTSNTKAAGRFSKAEFVYLPDQDAYRRPAGEMLTRYCLTTENDLTLIIHRAAACTGCPLKERCTTGKERRVRRWEHEAILDALAARMAAMGNAMAVRRETAEHPFATIKAWMGKAHFLCKGLTAVRTEMSLHVLGYNLSRMMNAFGAGWLRRTLAA